jgi:hypothetical protein
MTFSFNDDSLGRGKVSREDCLEAQKETIRKAVNRE